MGFKIKTSVLAVALATSHLAQAEQSLVMNEIVVNASSISDSAVDKNTLAHKRASTSDTAKLLEDQPGVSLYGAGGVSSLPVIHGMADDRVRVQVDGMDLVSSCPNHMNSPLSYIDPSNVDHVKVYAGITPVSVGGDSIAGTIQVDSKKPQFATDGKILLKGEAGIFYRSNGDANGENLAATIANESLSMSYAGSAAMSANYQAGNNFKATTAASPDKLSNVIPGDVVGSSAYKSQNHSLDFAYQNMKQLVQLKFGIQDIPYELYPNQRMDMLGNKSQQMKLSYADEFGWGSLEGSAWYENVDHYMDFGQDKQFIYGSAVKTASSTSTIVATGMPMYTKSVSNGLKLKGEIPLSDMQSLRMGAEVQNYRLNDWRPSSPASLTGMESRMTTTSMWMPATVGGMSPNTFLNINNGKRDRLALFTEVESKFNTHWNSLFGMRVEQVTTDADNVQGYNNAVAGYSTSAAAFNARSRSKTDNNIDLTALAQYIPNGTNTLELGLAQKTRSPNLYERYSWSQNSMPLIMNNFVGDGNGYLGNIDLKPEVARTLSATYDTHDASNDSAWGVKVTPYYTHVTDYIDAVRCAGSGTGMNALCGGAANNNATNLFVQMQYANQSASLYGADLSGHTLLGKTERWGEISASGVLSYVNGKNETTGDNLYNIMPLNARLSLDHKSGNWSNSVELKLVDAKTKVSSVRQEVSTAGYGLLNLRSSYELKTVRYNFGIENLFNQFYYLPLGGAYTGQGVTMSTNGVSWGIPVPGMGRSVNASVTVKF